MNTEQIEGFRLSPQQKHLWLQQEQEMASAFRIQGTIKIEGNIDQDILKKAISHVVCRYEILNTTFHLLPGLTVPVQVINQPNGSLLQEHNLTELNAEEQAAKIEQLFQQTPETAYDWQRGPLLKIEIVELESSCLLLLMSLPALYADAISLTKLSEEINRVYTGLLQDGEVASEEPLQYADIAEWQNELLESEDGEKENEYWFRKILSAPLAVKLPFENLAADNTEFVPQSLSRALLSDVAAKIDNIAAQNNVSPATFYLASWQILIHRYTNQSEMMFGVGCDGRSAEELNDAIGPFARHLPHPCRLDENFSFPVLLKEVEGSSAEALDRQEYFCWEQFGSTIESELAIGYFPLCFDFTELTASQHQDAASFSLTTRYVCLEKFNLKLECRRQGNNLDTIFHYDSRRFNVDAIERLAEQYHILLQSIIANPQAAIGAFNIIGKAEYEKLIVDFNQTAHDFPDGKCMHEIFEEQATTNPENIAVFFKDQQISYAELDRKANQMANHLQKLGVGPEVLVGLFMEPSIEIMVGLMGILKAGGAYVPIDPEYPRDRLDFILQDAQAPVLLSQKNLVGEFSNLDARVICLDTEWDKISPESESRPVVEMTAGNLAYVIYTSGSTGKPKGVLVTHRNLVHSTYARVIYYDVPVERYLLLSSFSFDSSVAGIFWSLMQGGALVLPEAGTQRDPKQITDLIARQKVTHTLCLASHYALIMSEASAEKMTSLKTNIVSGEVFSVAMVNRHDELAPQSKFYNEYGPTEASVWCIVFDCHDPVAGNQIPIGRPIANSQAYILNSFLQPVPLGAAGELYIGGVGITKGYLKRPELTEERFVVDPFSASPEARLYKTGDMARYLPNGDMEFLGRNDDQVKIRGYRIELGEIEAVLGQRPDIQEVAVLAREDNPGDKRLVAYLATAQKEAPTVGELRNYVSERLPDYMLPAAFVFMPELPRTPIGKLDRDSLPAPAKARPNLGEKFVAASTPLEEVLTGISADVLGIDKIGVRDNFFELGGHSILITQLAARVRNTLAVEIPLRTIFEAPTVTGLTTALFQNYPDHNKIEKTAELALKVARLSEDEAELMLNE